MELKIGITSHEVEKQGGLMKKSVLIILAATGLSVNAMGSDNETLREQINRAIDNGGIAINTEESVTISPDLMEIVKQIANTPEKFKNPVLIFSKEGISINDNNKLEDLLAKPGQTMTSL